MSRKQRFHGYFLLVGLLIILWSAWSIPAFSIKDAKILTGVVAFGTLFIAIDLIHPRLTFDETTVTRNCGPKRKRFVLPISELSRYATLGPEICALVANGKVYGLPAVDFPKLHAFIIANYPQIVRRARWKCGHLAPTEDFIHLWMFHPKLLIAAASGYSCGFAIGWFLVDPLRQPPIAVLGSLMAIGPIVLENFFSFLTLDREGITHKTLLETTTIPWTEITAVVCEGSKPEERQFTVISGEQTIVIPNRIAGNLEPMRKFFYSLPNGTLCVNFDANFNRGYRIRKRKGKPITEAIPGLSGEVA